MQAAGSRGVPRYRKKQMVPNASVLIAKFVSASSKGWNELRDLKDTSQLNDASAIQIEKSASPPSRARCSGLLDHRTSPIGKVFLVGAGPGHPDLLTVRALRVIEAAHVVVHDRLDSPGVLALVPKGAARIDAGKQAGQRPVSQAKIGEMLVRLARSGHIVVRLKAGDPLVFGCGGEEVITLAAAGIPFEVVPGITAGQACAAALCVPLTHRGVANSVRYLTGHCRAGQALDLDWRGLADPCTTLVVYMAMASIGEIAAQLVRHGRGPQTPALAISRATMIDQRWLASSLQTLAADVDRAQLPSPTLFIIGEAVSLAHINEIERHARTVHRPARASQSRLPVGGNSY